MNYSVWQPNIRSVDTYSLLPIFPCSSAQPRAGRGGYQYTVRAGSLLGDNHSDHHGLWRHHTRHARGLLSVSHSFRHLQTLIHRSKCKKTAKMQSPLCYRLAACSEHVFWVPDLCNGLRRSASSWLSSLWLEPCSSLIAWVPSHR